MRYNVPRPPCMEYPRYMREQDVIEYPPAPGPYPTYPPYPVPPYKPPYAKPYPNLPYMSPDYENPMYHNPAVIPANPNNPYPNPPYQSPGYEMPGYENPKYPGEEMPGYENPKYPGEEMPGYENPKYPGEEMPGYENPKYPGEEMPGYENPKYPGEEMPGYENPKYPGEEMPGYENPKYPGEEMPGHENPKYPGEEMPEHEKPVKPSHDNNHDKYCPKGMEPYTVRKGDTLYSIARKYGVSVEDLLAANLQISDPNVIYAGQLLCIPHKKKCDGFLYTIKPGDTLYHIAQSFGISLEELLHANPGINPESYRDGETLCIPQANPCPGNSLAYVVKEGDDLTTILSQTNVSLNALMAANPNFDPYNITPKTRLCVIPTPCEPVCPKQKRMVIPDKVKNIKQLAELIQSTTDAILMANPNYPPCHFKAGNSFCKP